MLAGTDRRKRKIAGVRKKDIYELELLNPPMKTPKSCVSVSDL